MTDVAGIIWCKLQFQSTVVEARTFDQSLGPYNKFPGLKRTNEIVVFRIGQQNHSAVRVLWALLNELTIFACVFKVQESRESLAFKFWSRLITGPRNLDFEANTENFGECRVL